MEQIKIETQNFKAQQRSFINCNKQNHEDYHINAIAYQNQELKAVCVKCVIENGFKDIISLTDILDKLQHLTYECPHQLHPLLLDLKKIEKTLKVLIQKVEEKTLRESINSQQEKNEQILLRYIKSKNYEDLQRNLKDVESIIEIENNYFKLENIKVKKIFLEEYEQLENQIEEFQQEVKELSIPGKNMKMRCFIPELAHQNYRIENQNLKMTQFQNLQEWSDILLTQEINPNKIEFQAFHIDYSTTALIFGIQNKQEFLDGNKFAIHNEKRTVSFYINDQTVIHNANQRYRNNRIKCGNNDIIILKADFLKKQVSFRNFTKNTVCVHNVINEVINHDQHFSISCNSIGTSITLIPMRDEYAF